jgi:hypothetical protein
LVIMPVAKHNGNRALLNTGFFNPHRQRESRSNFGWLEVPERRRDNDRQ